MARRFRPLPVAALLVVVLAPPIPVHAQTLRLAVAGTAAAATASTFDGRASLGVEGARVADTRVDLALAYDGSVQLDLGLQANDTFGPLGNVIGEASLALRTDAEAQGELGVRGVLGPVALGVRWSAFSGDPERFDPLALASASRPRFGTSGWGVALDASGRPSRSLILEAQPAFYLLPGGPAWRTDARLRWLRAIGPHELSVRLEGYLAPGSSAADGAIGVGLTYRRRDAPSLDGAIYVGLGANGVRPGVTLSLGQPLGPIDATLSLAAEPYRLDLAPYRARLVLTSAIGAGTARVTAAAAGGAGPVRAALGLSYGLPIELPSP